MTIGDQVSNQVKTPLKRDYYPLKMGLKRGDTNRFCIAEQTLRSFPFLEQELDDKIRFFWHFGEVYHNIKILM